MKISACVITKNEEENIVRNINSYKDYVDEIIVVDTGSTDKTVGVAKSLGATVYHFEWVDDFASAKNYALDKATGEWIIFMDADEYIDKNTASFLREKIQLYTSNNHIDAIVCRCFNIANLNETDIIDSHLTMRIFRSHKHIRFVGKVHEEIRRNNSSLNFQVSEDIIFYHTGYSLPEIRLKKMQRNLELLLKKPAPLDFFDNYNIGKTFFGIKNYQKSVEYLELIIFDKDNYTLGAKCKPLDYYFMSKNYLNEYDEKYKKAIDWAKKNYSEFPVIFFHEAMFLYHKQQYTKCESALRKAFELNLQFKPVNEENIFSNYIASAYLLLAQIYIIKNDIISSYDNLILSLKCNNQNITTLSLLCNLLKHNSIKSMDEIISLLSDIYNTNDEKQLEVLMQGLTITGFNKVLFYFWKIWYNNSKHNDNSVVIMLLANNRYEEGYKLLSNSINNNDSISNYESLMVYGGLMTGDNSLISDLKDKVTLPYKNIINSVICQNTVLSDFDFQAYYSIIELFAILTTEDTTKIFSGICTSFSKENNHKLCRLYFDNNYYELAFFSYSNLLKQYEADLETQGKILTNLAIINYRLNEFNDAKEYFEDAIKLIGCTNEINEYFQWMNLN